MSPESQEASQLSLDAPVVPAAAAATATSRTWPFYWSVRRELWENRQIYLAPLTVAALIVIGFAFNLTSVAGQVRALSVSDSLPHYRALDAPYPIAALLLMTLTFGIAVLYCLDALQGDRRDRSILFWKSLPVSDRTTVLAKASIPLVVLPLVTFAITLVTQGIMLILSAAFLAANGLSVATLWAHLSWLEMSGMLLYHLLAVHMLWYAPIYGWLLLVSAWSRRAAFLWAGAPLLAICLVERIAFDSSHAYDLLLSRLGIGATAIPFTTAMDASNHRVDQLALGHFLTSPGLWIGLALAAIFIAAAIRLRRAGEPN